MSSTITLVVPRAEKESVFLHLVVQAAIRVHREVKTTANDDDSRARPVALPTDLGVSTYVDRALFQLLGQRYAGFTAQQEGYMCPLALDDTDLPLTLTWYLRHLLINLVFWLLLLGVLLLFAYYTQALPRST